jgi:hypothetical protein
VASWLKLHGQGPVGFIDWLGFGTWLINQLIVEPTLAVKRLTSTNRTALNVTAENVQLAFCNAARGQYYEGRSITLAILKSGLPNQETATPNVVNACFGAIVLRDLVITFG